MTDQDIQIPPALKSLELPFPPKVFSHLSGLYKSQYRGGGLEFAELREYVAGDEARSIDWKASARSPKTFVKTYLDLRNQDVIFAIDGSSSMVMSGVTDLNSPLFTAGGIVSAIMQLAWGKGDRVGFFTMQDGNKFQSSVVGQHLQSRSWYVRIYNHIAAAKRQQLDWEVFLETLRRGITRPSLIVIISDDLVYNDKLADKYRLLRARGHRVWCIQVAGRIVDPVAALKQDGLVDVETGLSGSWMMLDKKLQQKLDQNRQAANSQTLASLKSLGVYTGVINSRADIIPSLTRLLNQYKRSRL